MQVLNILAEPTKMSSVPTTEVVSHLFSFDLPKFDIQRIIFLIFFSLKAFCRPVNIYAEFTLFLSDVNLQINIEPHRDQVMHRDQVDQLVISFE